MPSHPGARSGSLLLESGDRRRLLLNGEADIVEAAEQLFLARRIDVEGDEAAVGAMDLLRLQVDSQGGIGATVRVVQQLLKVFRGNDNGQNAVVEAVVVEDIGEGGRYHAADAEIQQRPGGVLARGAAA